MGAGLMWFVEEMKAVAPIFDYYALFDGVKIFNREVVLREASKRE
jgi:hypothetical protein